MPFTTSVVMLSRKMSMFAAESMHRQASHRQKSSRAKHNRPQTMSLFFALLPTDLQVDVLHGWINDNDKGYALVRTLSAMDVACANSQRAAFRFLVRQIPAFGESGPGTKSIATSIIKRVVNYVQWLGERGVAIQSLQLMENNVYGIDALNTSNVRLLTVESISWTCSQYLSSELVEAVLRVCPNLTHLRLGQSVSISPAITALLPKLKSIIKFPGSQKDKKLESMLTAFGPQLQELRFANCQNPESTFQLICDKGSQLQMLEIQLFRAGYDPCLRLLQSCKQLCELVVHAKGLDPTEIAKIAAYPQLHRLTVRSSASGHEECAVFAHIREVRPDLQYLNIGGWSYSAPEGSLSMYLSAAGGFDSTLVAGVLSQCPVKELMVSGIHLDGEMAKMIVQHLPGPLLALNVSAQDSDSLKILLCKFGSSLKHFTSQYAGVTDDQLRFIGTQCQLLESIGLNVCPNVSDEGVISLLTGCPLLKTVSMNRVPLTNATLHAIIKNKLRLKALALFACGLGGSSAEWFRRQLQEHQLLPMPEVNFFT